MDIRKVMSDLARTNLGSYEWRLLMFILSAPKFEADECVVFKLDDASQATGIIVPHVSRAMTKLIERNVVQRTTARGVSAYTINEDPQHWRSSLAEGGYTTAVPEEVKERFEKWWENYPKNIYYEDARLAYVKLVAQGVALDDLDKALVGYLKYLKARAKEQGRDVDMEFCLYPTTFLGGKWREFVNWYDYKPKTRL